MIGSARTFLLCTMICIVLFVRTANGQKYSSQYDNIDIDVTNPRLRNQYLNCIFNVAPCTTAPERYLKGNTHIPFLAYEKILPRLKHTERTILSLVTTDTYKYIYCLDAFDIFSRMFARSHRLVSSDVFARQ